MQRCEKIILMRRFVSLRRATSLKKKKKETKSKENENGEEKGEMERDISFPAVRT